MKKLINKLTFFFSNNILFKLNNFFFHENNPLVSIPEMSDFLIFFILLYNFCWLYYGRPLTLSLHQWSNVSSSCSVVCVVIEPWTFDVSNNFPFTCALLNCHVFIDVKLAKRSSSIRWFSTIAKWCVKQQINIALLWKSIWKRCPGSDTTALASNSRLHLNLTRFNIPSEVGEFLKCPLLILLMVFLDISQRQPRWVYCFKLTALNSP